MTGLSTVRLLGGGFATGQIVGEQEGHLLLAAVSRHAGTRGLVDPTPGAVVRVPLDLVIRIDDEVGATE